MTSCDHNWDRFSDVPGGEDPMRYRRCIKCGVIAVLKTHGYGTKDVANLKVLRCTVKKCSGVVVGRVWGRTHLGRIKWVCQEHLPATGSTKPAEVI